MPVGVYRRILKALICNNSFASSAIHAYEKGVKSQALDFLSSSRRWKK